MEIRWRSLFPSWKLGRDSFACFNKLQIFSLHAVFLGITLVACCDADCGNSIIRATKCVFFWLIL